MMILPKTTINKHAFGKHNSDKIAAALSDGAQQAGKSKKAKAARKKLENDLLAHIVYAGLPEPQREHRFSETRNWRFDFAYPDMKLAIEVEGGTWVSGRHSQGSGIEGDCEKYNAATLAGWSVLRFTTNMVRDGRAVNTIETFLREVTN